MATPRRAWFRAADSLGFEPWTNDELASLYRLMAAMNTRWARGALTAREASEISLTSSQILHITGRDRPPRALKFLFDLGVKMEWEVAIDCQSCATTRPPLDHRWTIARPPLDHCCASRRPRVLHIRWTKFSKFQRYTDHDAKHGTRNEGQSAPAPAPAPAEEVSAPSVPRPSDDANESARPKPPTPTERARAVWPRLVAAAARYGATVTWGKAPTKQATKEIAARIRDGLTDDQLEAVIHGAMKNWGPANGDWDPVKALKSTAVYRVSKYEEHLEAYQARTQTQSLDDEVAATRARIRAAHAREKREGAQA